MSNPSFPLPGGDLDFFIAEEGGDQVGRVDQQKVPPFQELVLKLEPISEDKFNLLELNVTIH